MEHPSVETDESQAIQRVARCGAAPPLPDTPLWRAAEIQTALARLRGCDPRTMFGHVLACSATQATVGGLQGLARIGDGCWLDPAGGREPVLAEIVAMAGEAMTVAVYGDLEGITQGSRVRLDRQAGQIFPTTGWRGRVIDALGRAMDERGPLPRGLTAYDIRRPPPPAHQRARLGPRLQLGVRALDLFAPCCEGQRLGVFAGSGVGKSGLLSMIAAHSDADVMVIGLIGERGRELNDFLADTLGPRGRARSVVVAATSDMPAMMRRRAAYTTMAVAEYFRDQGLRVLCLMDSITRFAMSLREIFLAAGEPPTSKGYPPAVFAELPRLLERAGPGPTIGPRSGSDSGRAGSITGIFSVLVEGDDLSEPIADAVRSILDGHVVMDRTLAERGHFPAIDVLKSVSRTAPACYAADERALVTEARTAMQAYANMAELIELGAYKHGSNPQLDRAIALRPGLDAVLRQDLHEPAGPAAISRLAAALDAERRAPVA